MSTPAVSRPVGLGPARSTDPSLVMGPDEQRTTMITMVASISVLIAVYWNMFALTKDFWNDDTYSHGWIVPFIGVFLLWSQRNPLGGPIDRDQENKNLMQVGIPLAVAVGCYYLGLYSIGWLAYAIAIVVALAIVFRFHEFEPIEMHERWIGVGLIVAGLLIRIVGALRDTMPIDRFSFIIALYGVFMLAGGFPVVRRMWASIGFFIFMFPLPSVVENHMLTWLQKVAAVASTAVLQVLGIVAYRKGNTIFVDGLEDKLEVAQACSGLRMLTIFSAMVIALVLLIDRPWWDKLILLLSAIPIALITNIVRITGTALIYKLIAALEGTSFLHWVENTIQGLFGKTLHEFNHDVWGYAMIFIAGGIMWFEYKVLSWLFVEEGDEGMQAAGIMGRAPVTGK